VGDLLSRIEITKLAHELDAPEADLAFLTASSPAEIRELREIAQTALFARNEDRVKLLAALSRMLPVSLTAKIAEFALGPMLSARVAGVLDPREATRLAGHLDSGFLARLAPSLDPSRVAPIVRGLADPLVVEVGRMLLEQGEHLTLSRFVSVVDVSVAMGVVADATGADLLQVAIYCDEPAALDAIAQRLPDRMLADIIKAASDASLYDAAVSLLASLSQDVCTRLVGQIGAVPDEAREELIAAVTHHDVWPSVLPALHSVDPDVLKAMVNVPITMDPELVDRVVAHARTLDVAPVLVQIVLAFDDEHLDVLRDSKALRAAELQDWLITNAGVGTRLIVPVLEALGLR
jgi:hypothetical protein